MADTVTPMRRHARHAAVVTGLLASVIAGSTALAAAKPNPETNSKLGPDDSAGAFLAYPSPTYQWHGCKLTSRANTLAPEIDGAPPSGRARSRARSRSRSARRSRM